MNGKTTIDQSDAIRAVDETIRNRETRKVLAKEPTTPLLDAETVGRLDAAVKESIAVSAWAPFHYDRHLDGIAEPWRYGLLFHPACRQLAEDFYDLFDDLKPGNKIPDMLMACGALVLVNWIPEPESAKEKISQINEEHLAATAAATQNLILALEARGLGTYWSSGGVLGSSKLLERVGLDPDCRLIAAVFVHYPGLYAPQTCEILGGKNRSKRGPWTAWTKVIE